MESPYYYLTPVSTEAPYILSDVGLQNKDDVTRVIGVAAMHVNPADNTVDLTASEGPTSTLMARRLLHLEDSLCPHTSTTLLSRVDRDEESYHPVRIIYPFHCSICSSGEIGGRRCYASIRVHTEPCCAGTSSATISCQPARKFEIYASRAYRGRSGASLRRRRAPKRKLRRKLSQRKLILQGNITNHARRRVGRDITQPRNPQPRHPASTLRHLTLTSSGTP